MVTSKWQRDGIDAVRSDGGLVRIRSLRADDRDGLRALHAHASDRSIYLRFFSLNRQAAQAYADRLTERGDQPGNALVACVHGAIVGLATFEAIGQGAAEISVLVEDGCQHEGIGTLLVEYLASVARHNGIQKFVAYTLPENGAMVDLLREIGFQTTVSAEPGEIEVTLDLNQPEHMPSPVSVRESAAGAASLRPLLAPRAIAVIGASAKPDSVGHQVLSKLLAGGFTGRVRAVNPHWTSILGVPSVPSPADLPDVPDLAIVAVPAANVPTVIRACGARGIPAVALLSAGFGESGAAGAHMQDEILAIARDYGMRLLGPNCVGLLNTDPSVRLNATFAAMPMDPGPIALSSQSGAFGIGFLAAAARRGLGVSQFVSVGNKADIGGNDLLLAWEHDPHVKVVCMYLESIGEVRKFIDIGRRVSRGKPILAIKSGRTPAGSRAGRSHTAAAATPETIIDAVCAAAGVLRLSTTRELLDAARVLSEQPPPHGPRVAIVGNSGGPGILAADAAGQAGLQVGELTASTQQSIRQAVPSSASTQNPIDLGAGAQPEAFRAAVRTLLDAEEVDAVVTIFTDVAIVDSDAVISAIVEAAANAAKPVLAAHVGSAERSAPTSQPARSVPVFTFPEHALAALGVAYRYSQIRARAVVTATPPTGIDRASARELIHAATATGSEWLTPADVARLLSHYRVPTCPQRIVATEQEATTGAAELGYPLAVKLAAGGIHKSDVGGVRLDVRNEAALRAAIADLWALPVGSGPLLIQPMTPADTELIIGAVHDEHAGPLIMIGAGGVLADLVDDRSFRVTPLDADQADAMINDLRAARLLDGYRGRPVASRAAVRDVLLRIAALMDDIPEIVELDLNPLACSTDQAVVLDARIRIGPPAPLRDEELRQLRRPALSAATVS